MFEQLPPESSQWGIFGDRNGDRSRLVRRMDAATCWMPEYYSLYSKVDYQNRIEVPGIRTSRTWLCDLNPYETG